MTSTVIERLAHDLPFPHLEIEEWLGSDLADTALEWLETTAPWSLKETSFYEQYEFSLLEFAPPDHLNDLVGAETIRQNSALIEKTFGVSGRDLVDITAHRLIPGQTIRLHNDFIGQEETHRLLVQLNRGWTTANGGLLMLFSSPRAEDVQAAIVPVHDSAFAFEISPKSYHAVSTISSGERYTLVYTFCEHKANNLLVKELDDATLNELAFSRMNSRHDRLDRLMD